MCIIKLYMASRTHRKLVYSVYDEETQILGVIMGIESTMVRLLCLTVNSVSYLYN